MYYHQYSFIHSYSLYCHIYTAPFLLQAINYIIIEETKYYICTIRRNCHWMKRSIIIRTLEITLLISDLPFQLGIYQLQYSKYEQNHFHQPWQFQSTWEMNNINTWFGWSIQLLIVLRHSTHCVHTDVRISHILHCLSSPAV